MVEEMEMVVVEIGLSVNFVVELVMWLLIVIIGLTSVSMAILMEIIEIKKDKLIKPTLHHQTQWQIQLGTWIVVPQIMSQLMLTI